MSLVKVGFIAVLLMLAGCAGSPVQTASEARKNQDRMLDLEIGQTKDEVKKIMGKPRKTESYMVQGEAVEFWLYLTEQKVAGGNFSDDLFTPLAFQNGKLSGWGRNYYDTVMRVEQDINVNIR